METIYRKVYTKDRLPEKEGVYYVEMNKGCCGLHEIHFWGHYHNRKDGKAQVRYWQNTFDWWLEEVEVNEEELQVEMENYSEGGTFDLLDGFRYKLWIKQWFWKNFITGKV